MGGIFGGGKTKQQRDQENFLNNGFKLIDGGESWISKEGNKVRNEYWDGNPIPGVPPKEVAAPPVAPTPVPDETVTPPPAPDAPPPAPTQADASANVAKKQQDEKPAVTRLKTIVQKYTRRTGGGTSSLLGAPGQSAKKSLLGR